MKLSVIILNYNVRYFLELCLHSVEKAITAIDAEVIVVDNHSPDDSCAMVKSRFPEVILLENTENVGFAKANNQGVQQARGEYICILNPDTVVAEDTFQKILEAQEKLIHMGLVGPKLVDGRGNFLPESKRNIPSPLTSFRRLFGVKLGNVKNYYADHIEEDASGEVEVLVGAFMWCKKEAYEVVAGFDEDYFMYGEDIDLSYKMKKMGMHNYYLGAIAVLHYKGESTDRNAAYIQRFYGAMRLFYQKHFKSNWILDVWVGIGIRMIALIQSFKKPAVVKRAVSQYYLVSANHALQQRLEAVLPASVKTISIESTKNLGETASELIFDAESMEFSEILKWMMMLRQQAVTFKIRPPGCDFIVGSDQSDGKGKVISF